MPEDDYQEITLADLVDTLLKRKAILIVTLLIALGAGAALSSSTPVHHVAETRFVPLGSSTIITSYLGSHQAAEDIVAADGDRLDSLVVLEPETSLASTIHDMVQVTWSTPVKNDNAAEDRRILVTIQVRSEDRAASTAIAEAYLSALANIRPILQDLHEDARFNFYFSATENLAYNVTEARELARQDAEQQDFWLIFDEEADVEKTGGESNLRLNLALGGVLGLMLGIFAAFTVEWWSNYRAERKPS